MFAEAAVCVQRVILQHEAAEAGQAEVKGNVISLSPPSQSSLMMRRHAMFNTRAQARMGSCGTLVEVGHLFNHHLCDLTLPWPYPSEFQESKLGQIVESPC